MPDVAVPTYSGCQPIQNYLLMTAGSSQERPPEIHRNELRDRLELPTAENRRLDREDLNVTRRFVPATSDTSRTSTGSSGSSSTAPQRVPRPCAAGM